MLDPFGAAPHKSDGVMVVDRAKVRTALAARDADTAAGDGE